MVQGFEIHYVSHREEEVSVLLMRHSSLNLICSRTERLITYFIELCDCRDQNILL